jgi:peptide/nickel transport system substrate-binding protein
MTGRLGRCGGRRLAIALIACAATAMAAGGCGGQDHAVGGSATVEMSTPPDYLDPQLGYTTEAAEADWIAYTPLLTYRHKNAPGGDDLVPGLAAHLPQISPNGKRYVLALRPGLVYSNGAPVKASDFEYTIERALRLGWGGRRFLTDNVVGARQYETGAAEDISGITTDDASGRIEIALRHPYSAFGNVLALPATGLVPSGTPMRDLSRTPPPGVGAYRITDVVRNRSWTMVKNPGFERLEIPDVPDGSLDRIKVRINPNRVEAAEDVIQDRADGYDPGTPLPAAALLKAAAVGGDRFEAVPIPSTLYFFLNATSPPFNSELARRAVVTALDRPALERLSNDTLDPECYLLPDGIPGHPSSSCPYGGANDGGDLEAAQELVQQSGTSGAPVTVWGPNSAPQRSFVNHYVKLLRRLGYRADARLLQPSSYYSTVGSPRTVPQTGFASWFNDFPNPADFYEVVNATPTPNPSANLGRVDDIFIRQQLAELNLVPAQEISKSADQWRDLEEYTAKKAYLAVFGTQLVPKLMSTRMNFGSAAIHPLFLSDWSTWALR